MFGAVVARALLGEGVEIHLIERCPDVLSSWNDARGHHLHRRVLVGHQTTAHAKHRHRAFVGCVLMPRIRAMERGARLCREARTRSDGGWPPQARLRSRGTLPNASPLGDVGTHRISISISKKLYQKDPYRM